MLDFPAPKTMAKSLRSALAAYGHELSHGQCLELVARQLGYTDWNVLSARVEASRKDKDLLIPEGWFPGSIDSGALFRLGVDPDMPGVVRIEARGGVKIPSNTFATLMQSISAQAYRSKRLRLTAELKSRDAGAGAIWMRIDPSGGGRHLRFDNMMKRSGGGALKGDADWTERCIVLDVPYTAASIHFGCLLHEKGTVWARNFRFETVDGDVPVTGDGEYPARPANLELG